MLGGVNDMLNQWCWGTSKWSRQWVIQRQWVLRERKHSRDEKSGGEKGSGLKES